MDDVVDGHLILSQDKSSRWATGEQTPQHRRRKDTSTNANSPSSYPLSLRINACIKQHQRVHQTAKLLSRNISATTTRTAALARNDPLEANSFAVETDNFSSSPLMVQQFFFERSQ